jgi:TonB family protein
MTMVAAVIVTTASTTVAQDALSTARDLYKAAAYEDALVRLDALRGSAHPADQGRYIEEYRAFCLLALGRTAEAERAMEAVVTAAPSFRPTDAELSPRVRAVFSDVRRRMLPRIIQEEYAQAKSALDRRDTRTANAGFQHVLDLLVDPDLASVSTQAPLPELRTLASGFRDLSARAAPAPASPSPSAALTPREAAPRRAAPRIYSFEDAKVVPAVVVRESWAELADVFAVRTGAVEIVIDETGVVLAATTRTPVNAVYDRLALATARRWRYKPATVDGVPVKFRKVVLLDPKATR